MVAMIHGVDTSIDNLNTCKKAYWLCKRRW